MTNTNQKQFFASSCIILIQAFHNIVHRDIGWCTDENSIATCGQLQDGFHYCGGLSGTGRPMNDTERLLRQGQRNSIPLWLVETWINEGTLC
mmetsp:Transcript_52026/g.130645  ORF Transcript_52026/g.130645 Transcript_52026/m.130645 type:complete len:92 (-) Transcript_52026:2338-2613(-)